MIPLAAIPAAQMMVDWLGVEKIERRIENASCGASRPSPVRTDDMGGGLYAMTVCARAIRERDAVL